MIFDDFAYFQCEVNSPGWTRGGYYDGAPGAGGPILVDASSQAGQDVVIGIVTDPPAGIFGAAAPALGHFFFNGGPFACGGSDSCAPDPNTLCLDLTGNPLTDPPFLVEVTGTGTLPGESALPAFFQPLPHSQPFPNAAVFGFPGTDPFKPQGVITEMNMCADGGEATIDGTVRVLITGGITIRTPSFVENQVFNPSTGTWHTVVPCP